MCKNEVVLAYHFFGFGEQLIKESWGLRVFETVILSEAFCQYLFWNKYSLIHIPITSPKRPLTRYQSEPLLNQYLPWLAGFHEMEL